MEKITAQLNALFYAAGMQYEVLVYEKHRGGPSAPRADRNAKELVLVANLLQALAPFKEELTKLDKNDI